MESLPQAEESNAAVPELGTPEFDAFIAKAVQSLNRSEEMWASAGFDGVSKTEAVREMLDPESQVEFDLVIGGEKRELARQRKTAASSESTGMAAPKKAVKPKRTRISI